MYLLSLLQTFCWHCCRTRQGSIFPKLFSGKNVLVATRHAHQMKFRPTIYHPYFPIFYTFTMTRCAKSLKDRSGKFTHKSSHMGVICNTFKLYWLDTTKNTEHGKMLYCHKLMCPLPRNLQVQASIPPMLSTANSTLNQRSLATHHFWIRALPSAPFRPWRCIRLVCHACDFLCTPGDDYAKRDVLRMESIANHPCKRSSSPI